MDLGAEVEMLTRTHSESFSRSVSAQGWVKCFSISDHYAKHSPSFFPSEVFSLAAFSVQQVSYGLATILAKLCGDYLLEHSKSEL